MDRNQFKLIHSELIQQVQCVESNLKIIYAAMHKGNFNNNLKSVEKMNLGKIARELQYLLGTTTSIVAENFDAVSNIMASSKQQLDDMLAKLGNSNNIFSSLVNNLRTVVSGGRLLFPNIWSNSGFSKSYSITINLTTPNYDKKSPRPPYRRSR